MWRRMTPLVDSGAVAAYRLEHVIGLLFGARNPAICSSPVAAPGGVWRIQCCCFFVAVFCFLRVAVLLNRPSDHFKGDFVVVVEKFS